jgi:hypothetical protein
MGMQPLILYNGSKIFARNSLLLVILVMKTIFPGVEGVRSMKLIA